MMRRADKEGNKEIKRENKENIRRKEARGGTKKIKDRNKKHREG